MGTYNYSARELADEINSLLNDLEGDFTIDELEKALRLVAVEHRLHTDAAKTEPYFDPELPEEYIEGVLYHQNRRAGKA